MTVKAVKYPAAWIFRKHSWRKKLIHKLSAYNFTCAYASRLPVAPLLQLWCCRQACSPILICFIPQFRTLINKGKGCWGVFVGAFVFSEVMQALSLNKCYMHLVWGFFASSYTDMLSSMVTIALSRAEQSASAHTTIYEELCLTSTREVFRDWFNWSYSHVWIKWDLGLFRELE